MIILLPQILRSTNVRFSGFIRSYNSWASMIRNNVSSPRKVLQIYSKMHHQAVPFDSFSVVFTLKSCSHLQNNVPIIRQLHAQIINLGFNDQVYVATSLLYGYVVASFSDACLLFDEMTERNAVAWNTMITGYSRLGSVEKARLLFDEMPLRNVESWSALISGYVNNGSWKMGLQLFREMMVNGGVKPDQVAVGSVLSGCAHMGPLGLLVGKSVHAFSVKNGWELNASIGTVLVDMYAKCGFLKNSYRVFELVEGKNVMSWTALICGSAQHGHSKEALALFEMMQEAGVKPNELTFTGILSACAQTGLVEEGHKYFKMIKKFRLKPRIQHYGCMVDLLGKAGLLKEAYEIINTMGFEPNVVVWGSFLSACKMHKQFEMAEKVIDWVLLTIKPENDGGVYSMICDLYVLSEKWDDAERIRKLMVDQNVRKARGASFVRRVS